MTSRTPWPSSQLAAVGVSLSLAIGVLLVFWPAVRNDFVSLDDDKYVSLNRHVLAGVDLEGTRWAFSTFEKSNWHPLTWLSLQLDAEWFGPGPAGYHRTNIVLHALAAVLLFLALFRLTGALRPSAVVAALFAVHPLRVESVAWVAERKDVLSGVFWMATLWAYAGFAKRPRPTRMLVVALVFAAGLLAKPMLVSLPFVLLLLDFWPLGRLRAQALFRPARRLVVEKLPLFALSAASCVVTWIAQAAGGAASSLESIPLVDRLANAAVACVAYVGKTICPIALAVFYPHPSSTGQGGSGSRLVWGLACAATIVAVTTLAVRAAPGRPYATVGWLWFLGALVPVIGIVQVGMQSMADRYTYLPSIGLSILAAWGIEDLLKARRRLLPAVAIASVLVVGGLAVLTRRQTAVWSDSITLYRHALAVTRDNDLAHNNLGVALAARGRYDEAVTEYEAALRIRPSYAEAHSNLGNALGKSGREREAEPHLREAVRLLPGSERVWNNLGNFLSRRGDSTEARESYETALRIRPDYALALANLGLVLAKLGDLTGAESRLTAALQLGPDRAEVRSSLGAVLVAQGRLADAAEQYERAVALRPGDAATWAALAEVYARQERTGEAERCRAEAVRRSKPATPHSTFGGGE